MQVHRLDDVAALQGLAGRELAACGAEADLARGLLDRLAVEPDAWGAEVWLFVATADNDAPLALAMQTGRFPMLVVGFVPADAMDWPALARGLVAGGAHPTDLNGAEPWSSACAAGWTAATGHVTTPGRRMRAFDLVQVVPPGRPAPGSARASTTDDLPLLQQWAVRFGIDVDEPVAPGDEVRIMGQLVADDELALWQVDGAVVAMAAINRRTATSANVAWVYTPPEHRGRGYASHVVAALSQRELDRGVPRLTLFTDLGNPTTNRIYPEVGYVGRCDFTRHAITR